MTQGPPEGISPGPPGGVFPGPSDDTAAGLPDSTIPDPPAPVDAVGATAPGPGPGLGSSPGPPEAASVGHGLQADRALLGEPARQAIIAVVFIALRFIRGLGAVQIGVFAVFLISGRVPGGLLVAGMVAAVIGGALMVLSWWRFTFVVEGDELVVNKGVLAQERLTIPLDRVQSVSINQSFLHRFIGVVSAAVDTAGSSAAEFQIDAIDRPRAEALQRLVAGHQRRADPVGGGVDADGVATAAPVVEDEIIINRTPMELVRIGASRWPWAGLVALAPLFAVLDDLLDFLPFGVEDGEELLPGNLPSEFGASLILTLVAIALAVLVFGAILGMALQIARSVVSNWDMKLIKTETGLRRTAGLFSTTSKASTLNRIQAVQTDQTPAQRIFGIQKLTLPTIGEGDIGVPGATEDELTVIRNLVFAGGPAGHQGEQASVPPPANDRMISRLMIFLAVRNAVVVAVLLLVVLALATKLWWSLVVLAWVPFQWLIARRQWRLRRWSLTPHHIAESYELVNSHTAEIDLIKAQTVSVTRSFFERRRGLATVRIGTAEGYLAVPLITVEEAHAVRDRALFAAESDRRSWM